MEATALQMEEVPFHGDVVLVVQERDGEVLVPLKRLCENLGIAYARQAEKVKGDGRFNYTLMSIVAPDGKRRKMVCLPLDQVSGWLFTVNANRVRQNLREKLNQYQRECVKVLDTHWRKDHRKKMLSLERRVRELETVPLITQQCQGEIQDPVLVDFKELKRMFMFAQDRGLGYPTSWLYDLLNRNSGVPTFELTVSLPGAVCEQPMLTLKGKAHLKLL
jgi:hypothetical protein